MVFHIFLLSILYVLVCSAFLLDNNINPNGQTVATGYYLTVTEFLEAQKQQHRDNEAIHQTTEALHQTIEALHQTMDKTLAVLTLQIQDKFLILEQKLQDSIKENETRLSVELLERKYRELEDNYTRMVHFVYDLEKQNKDKENEIVLLRNSTSELTHLVRDLEKQNADKENALVLLRNSTSELGSRIRHVEELKSFQQLTELEKLKHELQLINAQTGLLRSNELARNQDFLALYNETLALKKRTSEIEIKSDNFLNQTVASFNQLQSDIDRTRMEAERYDNKTVLELKKLSNEINEQVAITSCSTADIKYDSGSIVKFDGIKSVVGVNDVSFFRSSGKFTCKKEGLYYISASVTSYKTQNNFRIRVNENSFSSTYFDYGSGGDYLSATAVTTAVLRVNDTIWVETGTNMVANCCFTCLTIVKVK